MKAVNYLFALWSGLFVYTLLAVFFGPGGFSAQDQLRKEQQKLEANIQKLGIINRELTDSVNSLMHDRDRLMIYAREQGLANQNERFIRIVGLGLSKNIRSSPGETIRIAEPQFTDGNILRIIAFCTGISILLCMALFDFLKYARDKN